MNEYGPQTTEGEKTRDGLHRKTEDKCRQINERHGVHGIQRMLAMGGQPIQVFGAVVDRVEAPKEFDAMLKPMAPIDEQITQENDLCRLKPERLRLYGMP